MSLCTTKGPGDEITWTTDPAGVSVNDEDIQAVVAERVGFDPVGRDLDQIMDLMDEELVFDSTEAHDAAITYLAQHMDEVGFPAVLKASLTAAFTSIAEQTDVRYELSRRRHPAEID